MVYIVLQTVKKYEETIMVDLNNIVDFYWDPV
jgi:hypothetical protein